MTVPLNTAAGVVSVPFALQPHRCMVLLLVLL